MRNFFNLIKMAYSDFLKHDALSLGAALAFYTALSIAPLLIVFFWVSGLVGFESQKELIHQLETLIGPGAKAAFEFIVKGAETQQITGRISAIIAFTILAFASTRVFAQLHKSINIIWGIHNEAYKSILYWLRANIFSILMILVLGLLLVVSLFTNTVLAALFSSIPAIWKWINFIATPVLFTVIFMLLFKFLPKVKVLWRESLVASIVTSFFFTLGNMAIGKYLGRSGIASVYGAAGSLFIFLLWVYYQSLIVFFGAELMQVYSKTYGKLSKTQ